jgi:hypothetical protein
MIKIMLVVKKIFSTFKRKARRLITRLLRFRHLSRKYKILLFLSLVFILLILYLSSEMLLLSSARLNLAKLKRAISSPGPCHEDCLQARELAELKISLSLKEDNGLKNDIKKYLLDKDLNNTSFAFQQELLKIIKMAYGVNNPPDFLFDYLTDSTGNPQIKAEIVRLFLSEISEPSLVEYYFAILNSEEDQIVKEEVIRALSSVQNKADVFKIAEIRILKELILSDNNSLDLKSGALFLLSDYFLIFSEDTRIALIEIYESSPELMLKAITADILNNFGYSEFVIPEISDVQWSKYLNN